MTDPWENKNKTINKPKIAICIPYAGKLDFEWVDKTYVPIRYVATEFCNKYPFLCKVPSIAVARDILVNSALKADCDYLFFIDTDVIFENLDPNKGLEMLYQCMKNNKDAKIVSGLYRAKQKIGFNFAAWMVATDKNVKGFTPIQSWTGNWLQVDVTGLGCTLIDMEVFKNIERPWFKWELKEDISEDFYFFKLAKEHGYSSHVFTDVKLSHLGGLKVKSDGSIVMGDM